MEERRENFQPGVWGIFQGRILLGEPLKDLRTVLKDKQMLGSKERSETVHGKLEAHLKDSVDIGDHLNMSR